MINTSPNPDVVYMSSGLSPVLNNRLHVFNEGKKNLKALYM